jgi:enoyl-CoA hydratase/carnithine racemase
MYEFTTVEKEGHLTIITINRPESMNAVHPPASKEMAGILDDFESDPEQWVCIITGAGDRAFSAGNDLKYQASGGDMTMSAAGFGGITSRYNMVKPVIAAVNGIAMGGGFEIALASDIIVASEKAIFALPEPRVGLAALAGGMHRLPRQIGLKRAMGMMLTARRVSAAEGLQLGFVNEVVPHDQLMAKARQWANEIMECAPLSIRTSKQTAIQGLKYANIEDAMNAHYDQMELMFKSEDIIEGPVAFAQKRKPNWKGK